MVKNLPAMQETWDRSLGWKDPLGKGMASHSSILAGEIPGTEEPGHSLWGCKELDTTDRLEQHSTHEYTSFCVAIFSFLLEGYLRVSGTAESYGNCMFN